MTAASDGGRIAPKLRATATLSREAPGTRRRGARGGRVTAMTLDEITGGAVDWADARRKGLGPGLLESIERLMKTRYEGGIVELGDFEVIDEDIVDDEDLSEETAQAKDGN